MTAAGQGIRFAGTLALVQPGGSLALFRTLSVLTLASLAVSATGNSRFPAPSRIRFPAKQ